MVNRCLEQRSPRNGREQRRSQTQLIGSLHRNGRLSFLTRIVTKYCIVLCLSPPRLSSGPSYICALMSTLSLELIVSVNCEYSTQHGIVSCISLLRPHCTACRCSLGNICELWLIFNLLSCGICFARFRLSRPWRWYSWPRRSKSPLSSTHIKKCRTTPRWCHRGRPISP